MIPGQLAGGVAVGGGVMAVGSQVGYTGSIGLGSILVAIGAVVAGAFVRHSTGAWKETAEARQETINDLHDKLVELTAENRELAARPDMTTFMQVLHEQQRIIDSLAKGTSSMAVQILEALKTSSDLIVEHDRRANNNIDRVTNQVSELVAVVRDREQRFRRND